MKNIYGNNSGYIGYSMSKRAATAYENGKKPLSKFGKYDLEAFNEAITEQGLEPIKTVKELKNIVFLCGGDEWHHTSYYGNRTKFYDLEDVIEEYVDRKAKSYYVLYNGEELLLKTESWKEAHRPLVESDNQELKVYYIKGNKKLLMAEKQGEDIVNAFGNKLDIVARLGE